jgi:hypothetical protein
LPVERHGECRALGRDLVDVPFAPGFWHGINLSEVDDRAGAIARLGARVPDVHLIGSSTCHFVGIGAANENAAVGIGIDPELGPDLKIGIRVLRDQKAVALVGNDGAVLESPVGVTDLVPVVEVLAVEQRDSACAGLARHLRRVRECSEPNQKQREANG